MQGYTARFLAFKDAINTTLKRSKPAPVYMDPIEASGRQLEDMSFAMPL
jgi:hypothetical protein